MSSICLVTGAHGYVGGAICAGLRLAGWQPRPMSRNPPLDEVAFHLGSEVPADSLRGARALVHCAYDFSEREADEVRRINVQGTRKLFLAAREAGVERIMLISSMSAFDGCRSVYGRTKMELEALARDFGAAVVRPGLVYGAKAGGVFGQLARVAKKGGVVPLIGNGRQVQYLVHEEDLGNAVARWCGGQEWPASSVVLAHDKALSMRGIVETLSEGRVTFVQIPAHAVLYGLRLAEAIGLRLNFRSDSLVGLLYPNPFPDFSAQRALGLHPRPFPEGL